MIIALLWVLDVSAHERLAGPIMFRSDGRVAFGKVVVSADRGLREIPRLLDKAPSMEITVEPGRDERLFAALADFRRSFRVSLQGQGGRMGPEGFRLDSGRIFLRRR